MAFNSVQEFILMDGYGFFVWLSFGVTFLALALLMLQGMLARRQLKRASQQQQRRQQRLNRRQQELSK